MCYSPDGGDRNQRGAVLDCNDHLHSDCGHDDYFDTEHRFAAEPLPRLRRAPGNRVPVARDDTALTEKDVTRDLLVLANDTDPDDDALSTVSATDPPHGRAVLAAGATRVRYTPDPGYTGADSFSYRISDGRGGQATAIARLTVRDTTPPTVTAISPAANATAKFSEPMKAAAFNATSVQLVRRGAGTAVRASIRYHRPTRTVAVDPAAALVRGATYTARVTTGAEDAAGNRLRSARTWSFLVRR